jgi:hypothetical protein
LRQDLNFLKTFFSSERSIDERVIEATMFECNNDREKAFDKLMLKSSCAQVHQSPLASKTKKRKRVDFENEHMASASSTPNRDKAQVQVPPQHQEPSVN